MAIIRRSTSWSGAELGTFRDMSPDGKWLLRGVGKGKQVLCELAKPFDRSTSRNPIPLEGAIEGMDYPGHPTSFFSADSKTLAVRGRDGILVWDVASGKLVSSTGFRGVWFVLSPDSKTLVAHCVNPIKDKTTGAKADISIQVFDLATGKSLAKLEGDKGEVGVASLMVYSPDSKTIACGFLRDFRLWDAATGRVIATFEKPRQPVQMDHPVRFTPDGKTLVAVCDAFVFWNIASTKITASLPIESGLLAFSPDGATLATGGKDGRVRIWDMPAGGPIR